MQEAAAPQTLGPQEHPGHQEGGRVCNAYDIEDGAQEVNQDGREDDDVPGQVGLIDPTASFPEDEGQTLVILSCGDEDQGRVQHDQDGELDGHRHSPAGRHRGGSCGFHPLTPHWPGGAVRHIPTPWF